MPSRIAARLARLENAVIRPEDDDLREHRESEQRDAQAELKRCPELALVTEIDTDPLTFRDIQITLANARGDWAAAEGLEKQQKRWPDPPEGLSGDEAALWENKQLVAWCGQYVDAREDAVARVKARIAASR